MRALRELTADDLAYYAFKAMTTFGDAEDFKHFLPRLCELLTDELLGVSFPINDELLGQKIRYADYPQWPDDERAALRDFLMAGWRAVLAQYPFPNADTQLCLIAQCEDELTPYLAAWLAIQTPTALAHLAAYVATAPQSAWWDERPDQRRQVEDFLSAPALNDSLALLAYRFRDQLPPDLDPRITGMLRDLAHALE